MGCHNNNAVSPFNSTKDLKNSLTQSSEVNLLSIESSYPSKTKLWNGYLVCKAKRSDLSVGMQALVAIILIGVGIGLSFVNPYIGGGLIGLGVGLGIVTGKSISNSNKMELKLKDLAGVKRLSDLPSVNWCKEGRKITCFKPNMMTYNIMSLKNPRGKVVAVAFKYKVATSNNNDDSMRVKIFVLKQGMFSRNNESYFNVTDLLTQDDLKLIGES